MPVSISGTNGVTFPDSSLQAAAASPYVLKNRIINGDMRIDQRNAGASVTTASGTSVYFVDRFGGSYSQTSKFTAQQVSANANTAQGFDQSLRITSSSAYSVLSSDTFSIFQYIEGQNINDLAWGTASAKTVTLSFWVYSSLTGTFGGALSNSSVNRSYPFSYTISTANTWEQKSITIAGDTSGTWLTTNGVGIRVWLGLGSGSTYSGTAGAWAAADYRSSTGATSVVGTNGATFYITGVQLEQNTTATPFERRLYNQELANCQRYFYVAVSGANKAVCMASYQTSTYMEGVVNFPVEMRTAPSLVVVTGTNYYAMYRSNAFDYVNSFLQEYQTTLCSTLYNQSEASGTAGVAGWILSDNSSGKISFSAEL